MPEYTYKNILQQYFFKRQKRRWTYTMRLTVLGNNGPFPAAGGACSGYLVEENGIKLLVDCGNGVLSNLLKFTDFYELDAIILSHLHSDHMSDMMILRYAIQLKNKKRAVGKILDVYAPSEPGEEYARLDIKDAYNLRPIMTGLELSFGNLKVSFCKMKHPVKSYAMLFDNGSKRFVYSGDTSWNQDIIAFANSADLLMLDAGLMSKDKTDENVAHLTARECGIVARESGAKKLILTHFWPDYDVNLLLGEAKENFENADVSRLLETYEV